MGKSGPPASSTVAVVEQESERSHAWIGSIAAANAAAVLLALLFVKVSWVKCSSGSRQFKSRADVVALDQACTEFHALYGRDPTTLEELTSPPDDGRSLLKRSPIPLDIWSRPYVYFPSLDGLSPRAIFTLGRDGEPGGEGQDADISSLDWRR